jgi:hypothetical protein
MASKKPLPPKSPCKHKGTPMWVKYDGRYHPNLNSKKKQIIACDLCRRFGYLDNGKEVWE